MYYARWEAKNSIRYDSVCSSCFILLEAEKVSPSPDFPSYKVATTENNGLRRSNILAQLPNKISNVFLFQVPNFNICRLRVRSCDKSSGRRRICPSSETETPSTTVSPISPWPTFLLSFGGNPFLLTASMSRSSEVASSFRSDPRAKKPSMYSPCNMPRTSTLAE